MSVMYLRVSGHPKMTSEIHFSACCVHEGVRCLSSAVESFIRAKYEKKMYMKTGAGKEPSQVVASREVAHVSLFVVDGVIILCGLCAL